MSILHVGGDSVVEVAPCCAWHVGPTSRAKALLNSVDFWLELSSPFLGIGSPYLMCLTQNCCLINVKTCNFQYTLVCHLQDTMRKTNHQ